VVAPIDRKIQGQKCTVLLLELGNGRNDDFVEIPNQDVTMVFSVGLIVLRDAGVSGIQENVGFK
jgi:hypothetical protein